VESVGPFFDAVRVFADRLGDVTWQHLLLALLLLTGNLLLRTRAWWAILRAALPGHKLRYRSCAGAYLAGVGVNSIVPARVGDVVKVYLVHLRVPRASVTTIVATLLVETLFDSIVGPLLMVFALTQGVVPSLPRLPSLHAFEWGFFVRHSRLTLILAAVALLVLIVLLHRAIHGVRNFWARVRQGFAILRTPRAYLRLVVLPQALGWCLRVGAAYEFLRAFSITPSLRNALLVLVVASAGTLMPFTPGGVGTQQALIVVVLAGAASSSALVGFSVGMQAANLVLTVVLGFTALALMFRSLRFRRAIQEARDAQARSRPAQT
jgi:uncharacterized protein (TIRG00374 family)